MDLQEKTEHLTKKMSALYPPVIGNIASYQPTLVHMNSSKNLKVCYNNTLHSDRNSHFKQLENLKVLERTRVKCLYNILYRKIMQKSGRGGKGKREALEVIVIRYATFRKGLSERFFSRNSYRKMKAKKKLLVKLLMKFCWETSRIVERRTASFLWICFPKM